MSPDWFDPLGIRGSNLDPIKVLADAVKGEGLVQQSAEMMATTLAQGLVGRRIEIDRQPPVVVVVDTVHEIVPVSALATVPARDGSVPIWKRVRGRVRAIRIGDLGIEQAEVHATDVEMAGPTGQSVRIGRVEVVATLNEEQVMEWVDGLDLPYEIRIIDGRIEAADRRFSRWVWIEVEPSLKDQVLTVVPGKVTLLGRRFMPPAWMRRTVVRPAPWVPPRAEVEDLRITEAGHLEVVASMSDVELPLDLARLMREVGAEGTKSVFRIMTGDW